jgi:hypothetical protein
LTPVASTWIIDVCPIWPTFTETVLDVPWVFATGEFAPEFAGAEGPPSSEGGFVGTAVAVGVGVDGAVYVNWSDADVADVPSPLVTVMSTVPAEPAGEVAVIWEALFTVYEVADVLPNFTAVAPVKPAPVMVTEVPPAVAPDVGVMPDTVGTPVTVNPLESVANRPSGLVTTTLYSPAILLVRSKVPVIFVAVTARPVALTVPVSTISSELLVTLVTYA